MNRKQPTLVISPHLDDAVFGCGQWLATQPGCKVVTVFAGTPRGNPNLTDWDARCGFESAAQALVSRRREDELALDALQAEPIWLDFPDHQYGEVVNVHDIADELAQCVARELPTRLVFPLGLFHSDHLLASDAALLVWRQHAEIKAFAYEDALYRSMPGLLQQRLMSMAQSGIEATPVYWFQDLDTAAIKQVAVQQYASQLKAFGPNGVKDTLRPERFWQLQEIPA